MLSKMLTLCLLSLLLVSCAGHLPHEEMPCPLGEADGEIDCHG